jgi:hypothetical protein
MISTGFCKVLVMLMQQLGLVLLHPFGNGAGVPWVKWDRYCSGKGLKVY